MSGWKTRIGYLSPSFFETPSDWDLILPKGFTIVSSGLNDKPSTPWEWVSVSSRPKSAMSFSWGVSHWEPSVVTPPSNRWLPNYRGKLVCR